MSDVIFPAVDFAALRAGMAGLPGVDGAAEAAARARQGQLTKPPGSLGRLEDLAVFMAGWRGVERPKIGRAQAVVFAGNHGICAQGVNPYPQEVTAQMVGNFAAGGAAINQLCRANGADLSVVALELERPTGDFTQGPAMSETEVLDAMARGAAAVEASADVLLLGEMGIGNSTVAAALARAVFGGHASDWVGPGTGSDADGMSLKARVIEAGIARHKAALGDPLAVLAAFGGREQAAICGAVLRARELRIPVLLDGFICTAAAAVLHPFPGALDHCIVGHASAEPGHRRLLAAIDKQALLDLGMRLGEGSGAAVALGVLRAALEMHDGMATFAEAGVSGGMSGWSARRDEARLALMLLTRAPMGVIAAPPELSACVWAYPLAGVLTGVVAGAVLALAHWLALPPLACGLMAVAAGVLVTGGLHEDGLADLADGLGGGATRARKLEIMRDSRIGSYGALALVLAVGLRAAFVASAPGGWAGVGLLVGLGAVSRAVLPVLMLALPQARAEGLGARASASVAPGRVAAAVALGLVVAVLCLPWAVWVCVAAGLGAALVGALAARQLGGITGDVLGAAQVVAELAGWLVIGR